MVSTADIKEVQIACHYPDLADGYGSCEWQTRILLLRVAGPSWVCVDPDPPIATVNFEPTTHRILVRDARIDRQIAASLYHFDPITQGEMVPRIRAARSQLAISGGAGAIATAEAPEWRYSSPNSVYFAEPVSEEAQDDDDSFTYLGDKALVALVDGPITTAEQVTTADVASWKVARNH